ncbi:hypothetical protein BU17DRAFT_79422 [Hysterangium stoloniferum]|nr:hypothetical protein BU17DRAFT_79422 [Hysterangium stoloniferum]
MDWCRITAGADAGGQANLAAMYHFLGKWADTEQPQVQVLEAREQILGNEYPGTLTTWLPHTYGHLGKWTDAEQLEVKATEQILGIEHP